MSLGAAAGLSVEFDTSELAAAMTEDTAYGTDVFVVEDTRAPEPVSLC